jgi:tRNA A-37 threonylcarbamoyl transferase component Bud32/tetratricopeptide (TPR) repeat protein
MVSPLDPIAPLRAALRGHYDIEREIGQGAFATVYLARDLKHERKVALKVLHADPTSETGELRFIREIRLLARLQHPNILPLHDSGHVEALLYYVMPYVSGETLRARIEREKQLPLDAAISIAREVADALAYAHAQGVIHRDIKPENILLSTGHPILADFGIARAIDVAGVRTLTRTGTASPGTPAYMSPEQLMGDKVLDGRSDIYSLGCVLYEMVTGKPPYAGKEGFVKRFTEPPPKASAFRKESPHWLDDAIEGALQRDPQDRYPSAKGFAHALREPEPPRSGEGVEQSARHGSPETLRTHFQAVDFVSRKRELATHLAEEATFAEEREGYLRRIVGAVRSHPKTLAAVLVAALAAGIAFSSTERASRVFRGFGNSAALDPSRVVVLTFRGERSAAEQVTRSFEDVLNDWQDLHVASAIELSDALPRGGVVASLAEARAIARRLRARTLVWGEVSGSGESARVRGELYDLADDGQPARVVLIKGPITDRNAFFSASLAMLKKPNRPALADGGDRGTRSFAAWNAYGEAHAAFERWDLAAAARQLAEAVAADANYAAAQTWLAQILAWTSPEKGDWQDHANRAATASDTLSPRDRLIATAVGALAAGDYPRACGSYARLTQLEPRSFIGWYGLAECQRLDKAVVKNRKSPSGWSFRTSLHNARTLYIRALQLEPGAHALLTFKRMEDLLPTHASETREGLGAGPRQEVFAAYPSMSGDTLAFIPYPVAQFAALPLNANLTHNAALDRNSDVLLSFANQWVRQSPQSADAYEALADILEARGEVSEHSGTASALSTLLTARRLTASDIQRLRLSASEVRLRLKRLEFSKAHALADSLFINHSITNPQDAAEMVWLAALTGRINQTAQLARYSDRTPTADQVSIPPPLAEAVANLYAFAALGGCGEVVESLQTGLERALQSYVPEIKRDAIRGLLADRSYSMLTPCTRAQSALRIQDTHDRLYRMQRAYANNDRRTVRATFDSLAVMRRSSRPGDLTLDYTYQEAWLKTAMGDTAAAIRQLDLALNSLPTLNAVALKDPGVAAAVGRAIALRAELANEAHDISTARRWASVLVELWSSADKPLQPTFKRMKQLAAINES